MNRPIDVLYSSISQVHLISVIIYDGLDSPYQPNDHSESCMSFLNQIKIVWEIHWYTRLHVVNHWVPIHSEGKNIDNFLNDVYRPEGYLEFDVYGLQLLLCSCAISVGAFDVTLLYDTSFWRIRKKNIVAYHCNPWIFWVSYVSQGTATAWSQAFH